MKCLCGCGRDIPVKNSKYASIMCSHVFQRKQPLTVIEALAYHMRKKGYALREIKQYIAMSIPAICEAIKRAEIKLELNTHEIVKHHESSVR